MKVNHIQVHIIPLHVLKGWYC